MKKIWLGAAYYPELWSEEEFEKDIIRMKESGVNCVRIGEFAWGKMEPREGEFDFAFFEKVVDRLYENGISTVMCTPSCTPPRWLFEKYPEALQTDSNGNKHDIFARCHVCKTSEIVREKNRLIAREMAKRFGRRKGVIGWQIDNELYPYDGGCFCEKCTAGFRAYLQNKYATVENLNARWGTYRWSLAYDSFAQVIPPKIGGWPFRWQHPSLQIEWFRYQCGLIRSFVEEQAEEIRKYSDLPIGTDMMPGNEFGYYDLHTNLDVVQFNHYDEAARLPQTAFAYDFLRTVKDKPFWVTETQAGWNGAVTANSGYRAVGNCYANTWLPIAKGGEMNLYWHFRAHFSGHELAHGALYSTAGRAYRVRDEIKKAAEDFEKCAAFLSGSRVEAKIALHDSATAALNFRYAPILEKFNYRETLVNRYHAAFYHHNIDVVDTAHALDSYTVLLSPFLTTVDEYGLKERVLKWVQDGGRWIVGPMTDCMDANACKYTEKPFSFLEDTVGVYTEYQLPLDTQMPVRTRTGEHTVFTTCFDAFRVTDAESYAVYENGEFDGLTAVARRAYGKGEIILLGGVPTKEFLRSLVGEPPILRASENIHLTARSGAYSGVIAVETENKHGFVELDGAYTECIRGEKVTGRVEIPPYGVKVFVKENVDETVSNGSKN